MCRVSAISGLNRHKFSIQDTPSSQGPVAKVVADDVPPPPSTARAHASHAPSVQSVSLGPSCLSFLVPRLQNETTNKDAIGIWKGAGVILVPDDQKLGFLLGLLSMFVVVVVVKIHAHFPHGCGTHFTVHTYFYTLAQGVKGCTRVESKLHVLTSGLSAVSDC